MKKVIVIAAALVLTGVATLQAQSAKPTNPSTQSGDAQKNKLSQAQGKGVPYSQKTAAKKNDHNIPSPSVTTGEDASVTRKYSVGSHTAQREMDMNRTTKRKNPVSKSKNQ